jgi:hypothetical protein
MIIAQIATIPEREPILGMAVASLYGQVDMIHVETNSPMDGMKFKASGLRTSDDIVFICDDDIKYPPDFVKVMLSHLKPGIVVTVMGKILKPRPIKSFYRDELECFKTFENNPAMVQVEIPGTCGMAFHRATCPDLDETYFKSINSDIWMGIYCKDRGIPCYVIPHRADWLTNLMPLLPVDTPSVFDRFKDNDGEMTQLVNDRL